MLPAAIVRFETVKPTPMVVEPPLIIRLLNEVIVPVGRELLAVKITVPVPGVHVFVPLPITRLPALSVPPFAILIVPAAGVVAVPLRVMLPTIARVAPLVNVTVPDLPVLPLFPIVTLPETFSKGLPEVAKVRVPELDVVAVDPS